MNSRAYSNCAPGRGSGCNRTHCRGKSRRAASDWARARCAADRVTWWSDDAGARNNPRTIPRRCRRHCAGRSHWPETHELAPYQRSHRPIRKVPPIGGLQRRGMTVRLGSIPRTVAAEPSAADESLARLCAQQLGLPLVISESNDAYRARLLRFDYLLFLLLFFPESGPASRLHQL